MNQKYTVEYIHQYLKGELKREEAYELEKAALADPFLSDMIYGYDLAIRKNGFSKTLNAINEAKNTGLEYTPLQKNRKKNIIKIAAAAVVLAVLGIIGWNNLNFDKIAVEAVDENSTESVTSSVHEDLLESYTVDIFIVDEKSQPLVNEIVNIYNEDFTTDVNGKISIRPLKSGTNFSIDIAGYRNQQIYIPKNYQEQVMVQLSENQNNTSKLSIAKDKLYAPEGGWYKFQSYVETNKQLPSNNKFLRGSVIVKASLSSNHSLSEFEIVQSVNDVYDAEALRLIKNYNAWKNKMNAPIVVYLEVIF